jgi:hypothetical protein
MIKVELFKKIKIKGKNMIHLKGEIFLGLKKDEILLKMQDLDNETILTEQKTNDPESFINLYNYNIEVKKKASKFEKLINKITNNVSKNHEIETNKPFSLEDIYKNKKSDELVKYIDSLLNKLFPKYPKNHKVQYGIFGRYADNFRSPYSHAVGFRPTFRPRTEELETFDFQVNYEGINKYNDDMIIKISWDFEYEYDACYGNILSSSKFAEEILYALSETEFLENGFTQYNDISYSEITEYDETKKLQLIESHLVADINKLKDDINNLVELKPDHGDLLTLEEASSLINYDGYGYLCKEINGEMYQSFITPNMDYALPKIYRENFTHIYWYNR